MRPVSLSICIPTYNFGEFIGETLESIICQLTDEIEIVVLDGGSTDSTEEIVTGFSLGCPQLKYYRLDKRGGIDRDMAKTVDLAAGEYCWLFSSDDIMRPDAISKVLANIKTKNDIYLCKHSDCTLDMKIIRDEYPVLDLPEDSELNLSDSSDRERYFSMAKTSEAFFSFMSGIIIKRSVWCSIPINSDYIGSCWAHVARIFELMKGEITLKYLSAVYMDRRGENDSFSGHGTVNRFRIAVDGYNKIADEFYGHNSVEAFHIRRVVRNEYSWKNFLFAKLLCGLNPQQEDKSVLDRLVRKINCDFSIANELSYLLYRFSPTWLLKIAIFLSRASKYFTRPTDSL